MKRFLLFLIVAMQVVSLFADGSFYLFHDVNLIPNLSTDFYRMDNFEDPVETVNIPASLSENSVGAFISTYNTDMTVSFEIEWGNLEYDDGIADLGPYLPFTMEVVGDGNEDIPVTLNGSLGAGSVDINNIELEAEISQSWTRQFICEMNLTFTSDPQFSRAGNYTTNITINQISV